MALAIVEERAAPANNPWKAISSNLALVRMWLEEDRHSLIETNCDAWHPGDPVDLAKLDPIAAPLVARVEALLAALDRSVAFINQEGRLHG